MAETLKKILAEPQPSANTPPETFARVIDRLMDRSGAVGEGEEWPGALAMLNAAMAGEGFEAFYGEDNHCYVRHVATNTVAKPSPNPHRPFSTAELERR